MERLKSYLDGNGWFHVYVVAGSIGVLGMLLSIAGWTLNIGGRRFPPGPFILLGAFCALLLLFFYLMWRGLACLGEAQRDALIGVKEALVEIKGESARTPTD